MKMRTLYFGLFAYAFFLLTMSFVFQFGFHLHPCPLCIIDRLLVIALTILFGMAFLHSPKNWGHSIYSALGLTLTVLGILVTARHLWLIHLPPGLAPDCSPGLNYLIETLPLKDALVAVLKSSGECAQNNRTLLGFTLPGWTMIGFIVMAIGQIWVWIKYASQKKG